MNFMANENNSLKPGKIIFAGITGTSFMTAFSYLVSESKKENFREPELLGKLLYTILPDLSKRYSHLTGWNLHYLVGVMFALAYSGIWEKTTVKPSLKSGLIFGLLSGVLGLSIWKLCFEIHPNPPKISFKKYYGHLLVTHLVFGLFTTIAYQLSSNIERVDNKKERDQAMGTDHTERN